jgi:TIR domain-containing protein/NACHT domain-containing protein
VWFDEWVIRPGDDIYLAIERGLEAATVQVLCLSPAALESDWVTLERSTVLFRDPANSGRRFIPLLLADCALPDALRRYKHVDFREDAEAAFEELLKICRVAMEQVPEPLPPTGERHGNAAPCSAAASGMAEPWTEFRARLAAGGAVPELDEETRQALLRHAPATVEEYRLARVAEWSQPRFDLDKRFTRLTLLLDQGPEAQGVRWEAQSRPQPFDDLRDVLNETDATALVLLGPPGCGKSTLLRRLELDLALDALRGSGGDAPLSLFLPLSRHRPARAGGDPPPPRDWLAEEWAQRYPRLPGLPELLRRGPFLLLLDAVNEIPHAGPEDYRGRIGLWRELLADLAREAPGVRAVFTCRSLDYSALLSTPESPVPQVRIEPLEDQQVEQFLGAYDPDRGPRLWRELRGTPQLELFRSPFYLRLLLAHPG